VLRGGCVLHEPDGTEDRLREIAGLSRRAVQHAEPQRLRLDGAAPFRGRLRRARTERHHGQQRGSGDPRRASHVVLTRNVSCQLFTVFAMAVSATANVKMPTLPEK